MTDLTSEFEISSFTERDRMATARAIKASAASKLSRAARPRTTPCVSISEKHYTPEEMAFLAGIESFKNRTGRKFPTWTEVLGVVRELGYKRNG
jgi:hypothetical protein